MVYRKTKTALMPSTDGAVTTYDIAQAIGISATTVSSILSGRNVVRVSEATRNRVLDAARAMGYRRNGLATALRTGRSNTLGIVSPLVWDAAERQLRETYLANLLAALSVVSARAGMTAMTFVETSLEALSAEVLVDGRVDGVVLFGMPQEMPGAADWVRDLYATRIPCVEIGSRYGTYQVHADNVAGARAATEHLIDLGHRRIGYCGAHSNVVSAQSRERGFRAAVQEAGLADTCPVLQDVSELATHLHGKGRLTALFCYNDATAIHAYQIIRAAEQRIPKDISVVGFDDSPYAEAAYPALTTVTNPLAAMAEAAVALVRDQIAGNPIDDPCPLIETALVLRQSTAAFE